jgi:membrane protease YdiL (CAAX protease family)
MYASLCTHTSIVSHAVGPQPLVAIVLCGHPKGPLLLLYTFVLLYFFLLRFRLPNARQLGLVSAVALWATLVVIFIFLAVFTMHGSAYGRAFVAAVLAFALLLAVMLLFAARNIPDRISTLVGPASGWLLGVILFFSFLVYAFGTGTVSFARLGAAAAFIFLPLALLSSAQSAAPGTWQDFFMLAAVWVIVKFGPAHWFWPYPGGRLAYVFTVMLAVDIAIAGFLLLRKAKNVGYGIAWSANWALYILGTLALFASIVIPLGLKLGFLVYSPHISEWKSFLPLCIAILFFTAWPEELLFRGLLQNFLSRATNNNTAGCVAASILFGFSHITNMHFPNWRYVLLASIAGLFYGWTWRKTGSIFASSIVHASVDILWHSLFLTP